MLYEYSCVCGRGKTKKFPIGKKKNVKCLCGKTMDHVIKPSFILRGSGWAGKSNKEEVSQPE